MCSVAMSEFAQSDPGAVVSRMIVTGSLMAGFGIAICIAFTIMSGIDYRIAESRGLDPGYAPAWIVFGTYLGVAVCCLGLFILLIAGVIALRKRLRQ